MRCWHARLFRALGEWVAGLSPTRVQAVARMLSRLPTTTAPMTDTPSLYDPIRIGAIDCANRIVMAPLTRSRAAAGLVPSPMAAEYYGQRATAGLIVSEATQVNVLAQGYIDTPGLYTPAQIDGWRRVTESDFPHGVGQGKQIVVIGTRRDRIRFGKPDDLPADWGRHAGAVGGAQVVAARLHLQGQWPQHRCRVGVDIGEGRHRGGVARDLAAGSPDDLTHFVVSLRP